jgi:hypothetical protein
MIDLMQAIENDTTPISGGRDNLETIALLEAIFQSGTTHQSTSPKDWFKKRSMKNPSSYQLNDGCPDSVSQLIQL